MAPIFGQYLLITLYPYIYVLYVRLVGYYRNTVLLLNILIILEIIIKLKNIIRPEK